MKKVFLISVLFVFISLAFMSFYHAKQKVGVNIGDIAPEIALNNPDGKVIKLSALKGHYVILDFWASWCGPCRRANPSLVRIYKTYSAKKFDNGSSLSVFSVSLDKDKNSWLSAIKSDQLEWQDHVCDFMGWRSSSVAIFGVESIPTNFILDGEGRIVAKDLQDTDLSNFLNKRLKK